MNRSASRTGVPPRLATVTGRNVFMSMDNSASRIAKNETPLIMKHQPVPMVLVSAAASAGPKILEPVITAVLSDIALGMSMGSTSSVTNPRRAGLSSALMTPTASDST